jgi:GntR family transcriptional regulator / MocR family aminotransferase
MPRPQLHLPIDRDARLALFLQIARQIASHVRHGRLRAGDPLPGTRDLARTLGVHRNTVIAAYEELALEGWITTHAARGSFISQELPDHKPRRLASTAPRSGTPERAPYRVRPGPTPWITSRPATPLSLAGGRPDLGLVPVQALARAYRRTLRRHGRAVLEYGDPRGHERLRMALAEMLVTLRAVPVTPNQIVVTHGGQMALGLVARALITRGDVVAVEALGYPPAWEVLRDAGATLAPIEVDDHGLDVDAVSRLARRGRLRAVYCTPHHQCPTTVSLSPGRRMALLELARRHRVAILEDDYDHEFHYDGRPLLPLASADPDGHVIYLGTLSKVFAPGLRLGYLVAPTEVVESVAARRSYWDLCGDPAIECALAELFEDGEVQRHVRRVRRVYQARRDALIRELQTHLAGSVRFKTPSGGISLWCTVAKRLNVEAWAARCERVGVRFGTGRRFAFDGQSRPAMRLGFASLSESQIKQAVSAMQAAL